MYENRNHASIEAKVTILPRIKKLLRKKDPTLVVEILIGEGYEVIPDGIGGLVVVKGNERCTHPLLPDTALQKPPAP